MKVAVRVLATHWYVDIDVQAESATAAAMALRRRDPDARVEVTQRGNVLVYAKAITNGCGCCGSAGPLHGCLCSMDACPYCGSGRD